VKYAKDLKLFVRVSLVILFFAGLVLYFFGPGIENLFKAKVEIAIKDSQLVKAEAEAKAADAPKPKCPVISDSTMNRAIKTVSEISPPAKDYVSPKKLANMAFADILTKYKEDVMRAVLSDKAFSARILEELEIRSSVQIGIEKCPEIMAKYGQLIGDSMEAKLSNPTLGIPDSINLKKLGVAMVSIESQGDSMAYNRHTTASGLMQLIFTTARELWGKRGKFPTGKAKIQQVLFRPEISVSLGTDHLLRSARLFHGDVKKMLIGYEAGDGKVEARIRHYKGSDKISYVRKVWPVYCYLMSLKDEVPKLPEVTEKILATE